MINAITQLREQAEKKFTELELPSFKHGNGFSLDINVNWEKVFTEIKKAEDAEIVADKRVKICKLSELGEKFISKYGQTLVSAENKSLALHYATNPDATVIIIPKHSIIEEPIIINSETKSVAAAESIIVVAEEGAQAIIIEIAISNEAHYKSQTIQIHAQKNAKVTYCTVHNEEEGMHSFTTKRAEVLQNANIQWFDFAIGNGFSQIQLRSYLQDNGAEAQQYQALVGTKTQQCDINSDVFHGKSNTKSVMFAKGILSDKSRAMYRGIIRVEKDAINCQGHQRSDVLLIGEEARCNAIPVLEVENDTVSCSHATTMGQIDEEQLYYLLSRGLDQDIAKQMLVIAFLEPILQKLSHHKTREEITNIIQQKLQKTRK